MRVIRARGDSTRLVIDADPRLYFFSGTKTNDIWWICLQLKAVEFGYLRRKRRK